MLQHHHQQQHHLLQHQQQHRQRQQNRWVTSNDFNDWKFLHFQTRVFSKKVRNCTYYMGWYFLLQWRNPYWWVSILLHRTHTFPTPYGMVLSLAESIHRKCVVLYAWQIHNAIHFKSIKYKVLIRAKIAYFTVFMLIQRCQIIMLLGSFLETSINT